MNPFQASMITAHNEMRTAIILRVSACHKASFDQHAHSQRQQAKAAICGG